MDNIDPKELRAVIDKYPEKFADMKKLGSDQGVADILNALTDTLINKGVVTSEDFFFDFGFMLTRISFLADAEVKAAFKDALEIAKNAGRVNLAAPEIDGDLTATPPIIGFRQQAVAVGLCTDDRWKSAAYRPASLVEIEMAAGVVVSSSDVAAAHGEE